MPSWIDVEDAARKLANYLTPRCSVEKFQTWIQGAAERPANYGFPRSYARRPNWDASILRTEVSWVLWHTANHPAKGGFEYRGLPKWELSVIADGNISRLWSGAGVTSKLRHEWLTACAVNRRYRGEDWRVWLEHPLSWVCRHAPVRGFVPRTLLIASWLEAKKEWKGWKTQIPVGYGANGEMSLIDPVAMLDEIWESDLTHGIKSSPEKVFRAVLARTSSEELERMARENLPLPVMPWEPIQGITQILTAADLVVEGERMKHCVGGYVDACREGQCFIVRLRNSTAEITPDGYIHQHMGYKNSTPPEADRSLLERWQQEIVALQEKREAEAAAATRKSLLEANDRISAEVSNKLRGMTHMESSCLSRIHGLITLEIPETIKTLDEDAIAECWELETIRLPKAVEINEVFFRNLCNLERIYCSGEQVSALRKILALEQQRSIYLRCPNEIALCIS